MHEINVSVVFAIPAKQWIFEQQVARGTSAHELIVMSGFDKQIPQLSGVDLDHYVLGIFSQKTTLDTLLEEGDRLEIYRPLTADPKEVRRQLALMGKTMGKK
jgi:putative ubiquitin-RnfH superfamily antitoxin RatB of RatAB toxin-antitoxin module